MMMRRRTSLKLDADTGCAVCCVAQVDHVDLFANKRAVFTSSQQEQEAANSSSSRTWAVENVNP